MQRQKPLFPSECFHFLFFPTKLYKWLVIHASIATLLTATVIPVTAVVEVEVEVDVLFCIEVSVTTNDVITALNTSNPSSTSPLTLQDDQ